MNLSAPVKTLATLLVVAFLLPIAPMLHAQTRLPPDGHLRLIVHNGTGDGDSYYVGQTVPVGAQTPSGFEFVKWFKTEGDGSLSAPLQADGNFIMGRDHSEIAATFAKLESWFPPGPEGNTKGLLLPKSQSGQARRLEQRLRVTLNRGSSARPPYSEVWGALRVKMKWKEATYVRFFTAETGGQEIANEDVLPKDSFKPKAENVYEASIWYEGNLAQEQIAQMSQSGNTPKVTIQMNFVVEGTDKPISWTGALLPVELITPAGDPVNSPVDGGDGSGSVPDGANEFTYSTAASGVLTLKLKAKVSGIGGMGQAIQDRFKFEVEAIGNSTLAWDAANPGGKVTANGDFITATVTFTGLPQSNPDFGKKKARVTFDGSKTVEREFEVFFAKTATNHPGTGSGTTPNWFFYWKEDQVCGIPADAIYDPNADYGYVRPGVDRKLRLGSLAADSNNGPETFSSPTTYGSLTVTGHGKGIQCVAETAEHELHHLAIFDDAAGKTDGDHDGVATSSEGALDGVNSDPSDGDTFKMQNTYGSVYASYGDNEIRCRKKELNLTIKYYPKKDWANPGCQSKVEFGPKP